MDSVRVNCSYDLFEASRYLQNFPTCSDSLLQTGCIQPFTKHPLQVQSQFDCVRTWSSQVLVFSQSVDNPETWTGNASEKHWYVLIRDIRDMACSRENNLLLVHLNALATKTKVTGSSWSTHSLCKLFWDRDFYQDYLTLPLERLIF